MLASYASMWVLAALMPKLFTAMGLSVSQASAFSSVMDVVRVVTFVVLWRWHGWHGRRWLLVLSVAGLPAGFFLVVFGDNLSLVLAGQVLFGLTASVVYYAALYYALVVKNASVDAGGGHEGLIGLGMAFGPAAGLVGMGLAGVVGQQVYGVLIGIAPVFLVCSAGALRQAAQARRGGSLAPPPPQA